MPFFLAFCVQTCTCSSVCLFDQNLLSIIELPRQRHPTHHARNCECFPPQSSKNFFDPNTDSRILPKGAPFSWSVREFPNFLAAFSPLQVGNIDRVTKLAPHSGKPFPKSMALMTVACRQTNSEPLLNVPYPNAFIRYHGTSDIQATRLNVYFNEVREIAGPRNKTCLVSESSQH